MTDVREPGGEPHAAAGADSVHAFCHELRQPLVVAVGYVSMLEEGAFGELSPGVSDILRTIAGRLDAMNEIIDRLATDDGAAWPPPG